MTGKSYNWRTMGITLKSFFGLRKKYAIKDLKTNKIICYVASEKDQEKLMKWVREEFE